MRGRRLQCCVSRACCRCCVSRSCGGQGVSWRPARPTPCTSDRCRRRRRNRVVASCTLYKMLLNYDDSAFSFFAITVLWLYTVPAAWIILRRIARFKPDENVPKLPKVWNNLSLYCSVSSRILIFSCALLMQARSALEEEKLSRVRAAVPKAVLWTTGFKVFVAFTFVASIILAMLTYVAMNTGQLAAYDPYAVRFRLPRRLHQHGLPAGRPRCHPALMAARITDTQPPLLTRPAPVCSLPPCRSWAWRLALASVT